MNYIADRIRTEVRVGTRSRLGQVAVFSLGLSTVTVAGFALSIDNFKRKILEAASDPDRPVDNERARRAADKFMDLRADVFRVALKGKANLPDAEIEPLLPVRKISGSLELALLILLDDTFVGCYRRRRPFEQLTEWFF